MAHVQTRTRNGKKEYGLRYLDPSGALTPSGRRREISEWFTKKGEANAALRALHAKVERNEWVDPANAKVTFAEYVERWVADQVHHAPNTVGRIERDLRNHVVPHFGPMAIGSVRKSHVQAFVRSLTAKGLAPATVHLHFTLVGQIFKSAVGVAIPASPCEGVNLPKLDVAPGEYPTTDEVRAIIGVLPARYTALGYVLSGLGLRIGEGLGLRRCDVDFLRGVVHVRQQVVTGSGAGSVPTVVPPKCDSYRDVPLPAHVRDALAAHVATYGVEHDGLLFTTSRSPGAPMRTSTFEQVWGNARDRVALGFSPHDFRHYYASLLIASGEDVATVQARLGHSTPTETLNTYTHLWPKSEDRTRAAVDAEWSREPVTAVAR